MTTTVTAPPTPAAPVKIVTPQQMIRMWVREWLNGRDLIDNDEMLDAARARFENDDAFRAALIDFALTEMVPSEARAVFGRLRMLPLGGQHMSRAAFDKQVSASDRWRRWRKMYESVGDGRRVCLLSMTRVELRATAADRTLRANGELLGAGFLLALADKLSNDKQTVGKRFTTPEELDAIHARVKQEIANVGGNT